MKPLNQHTSQVVKKHPVKVLQFGEGNFLRGFVDWMIDILNEKTDFGGGVTVVQPIDQGLVSLLNEQDCLYHVLLNGLQAGKASREIRLITCLNNALNPYQGYEAYLKLGENPALEFVISNTTESGIAFDATDTDHSTLPASFPGKLTALLYHRYKFFKGDAAKALTIIPCELIEHNGSSLRLAILNYAEHWQLPEGFVHWILEHTIFCNTLVDRIVPGFPRENIQDLQLELGYEDKLVVTAEPFHLWVIEGPESVKKAFPAEEAGLQVKFVQNQTPYRTRKVRILNGAHTALVPVAYLQGLRTVRQAVDDPLSGKFIREAIYNEIIPTLDLPRQELEQFAADVIERFQNPFIRHELLSIALNSISKYRVRVLPSVLEYIKRNGQLPTRLLQALAALILFYRGEWKGEKISLNDSPEVLAFFQKAWTQQTPAAVVTTVLANTDFWGLDLSQMAGLPELLTQQLQQLLLQEEGTHSSINLA